MDVYFARLSALTSNASAPTPQAYYLVNMTPGQLERFQAAAPAEVLLDTPEGQISARFESVVDYGDRIDVFFSRSGHDQK